MAALRQLNCLRITHRKRSQSSIHEAGRKVLRFQGAEVQKFLWVHGSNQNIPPAPGRRRMKKVIKIPQVVARGTKHLIIIQRHPAQNFCRRQRPDPPLGRLFKKVESKMSLSFSKSLATANKPDPKLGLASCGR
jgi:hypothetical protein